MDSIIKRDAIYLVLACAISVLFMLVFSYNTSPLTSEYGFDQAFFQLVGAGMHDGMVPYRDFHDMKGPYLFFMEWFGQLLCRGRFGCFLLQVICSTATFFLIFKLMDRARSLTDDGLVKRIIIGLAACVPCLLVLAVSLEGGNLPEELSLPFLMASTYCNVNFFIELDKNGKPLYKRSWAIVNGICVCIVALMRITNAAFMLTTLLCVAIAILRRGKTKHFLVSLGWFVLGVVVAAIPAVVYCLANGVLGEMVYLVFLFGFSYSGGTGFTGRMEEFNEKSGGILPTLMWWALSPVVATLLVQTKRAWAWGVSALGAVATYVGIFVGHGYVHYAGTRVPLVAFAAFLLAYRVPGRDGAKYAQLVIGVVAMLVIAHMQMPFVDASTTKSEDSIRYHQNVSSENSDYPVVMDVANRIPLDERDSVFCFGDTYWSRWYCMSGIYPEFRYCDYQGDHFAYDRRLEVELERDMEERPPQWLVTKGDVSELSPLMGRVISDKYELSYENEKYALYHLISPSGA